MKMKSLYFTLAALYLLAGIVCGAAFLITMFDNSGPRWIIPSSFGTMIFCLINFYANACAWEEQD